jgi:hypothetical protein
MMTSDQVGGIIRALLAAIAGYAAGKGFITTDMGNELVGAGVTVGVAIWSVLSKKPTT